MVHYLWINPDLVSFEGSLTISSTRRFVSVGPKQRLCCVCVVVVVVCVEKRRNRELKSEFKERNTRSWFVNTS
jgi:hypothetical protein